MNFINKFFPTASTQPPAPPISSSIRPPISNTRSPQQDPPKYIVDNGVTKINPAFVEWRNRTRTSSSEEPIVSSSQALVTFSTKAETEIAANQTGVPLSLAPSYLEIINIIEQDPDIREFMDLTPDAIIQRQEAIRVKYDIPLGLGNKLFALSGYKLDFIVDDSYSMDGRSSGRESRWQEAQRNIK